MTAARPNRAATFAVLLATFAIGLGEELWSPFFPDYLFTHLGVSVLAIAGYSALTNVLEAAFFLAGGSLGQRLGIRGALVTVGLVPVIGYALLLGSAAPVLAVAGALCVKAFEPLSVPATFVVLGAATPAKQSLAFALHSIQKRIPKVIGPVVAGLLLAAVGVRLGAVAGTGVGMTWLLAGGGVLAVVSVGAQWRLLRAAAPPAGRVPWRVAWAAIDPGLQRLLPAEVAVRWSDWMVRDLAVLYVVSMAASKGGLALGRDHYGWLVGLQMTVALATYLPVAWFAPRAAEHRLVGLTFVAFAAFPLLLWAAAGPSGLLVAYAVNGLREIGEPARKALITGRFPEAVRASGVGLYWGVRALCQAPAPLVSAAIWLAAGPRTALLAAAGMGALGCALYLAALPALRRSGAASGGGAGNGAAIAGSDR